jgi:hypothetical protein
LNLKIGDFSLFAPGLRVPWQSVQTAALLAVSFATARPWTLVVRKRRRGREVGALHDQLLSVNVEQVFGMFCDASATSDRSSG